MNEVTCNKCGEAFVVSPDRCHTINKDELTVEYFECPFCLTRYHYFTSNAEMRELIAKRRALVQKIHLAQVAKARAKTIKEDQKQLIAIKAQQLELTAKLSARGAQIIKEQAPSC